jgi:hypothetical protein
LNNNLISTDSEIKTGVCVFDLHYPNHNKALWENIINVISDLKPD